MASDTYAITSRNIKALGPIPSAFSLPNWAYVVLSCLPRIGPHVFSSGSSVGWVAGHCLT